MEKKKMIISAAIVAGVAAASYKYFKANPDKLDMIKDKMKCVVDDFEDEMMM